MSGDRATFSFLPMALLLSLIGITEAPARSKADDPWVGKAVVQKANPLVLRREGGIVENPQNRVPIYHVVAVNGPWIWLRASGLEGWADASEVVPVDQAIPYYTERIRVSPENPFNYSMRAMIRLEVRKEYDLALADYNEAIRLDQNSAHVYNNRGLIYLAKKDFDRAIADYDRALRLDPKYVLVHNNRGNAWMFKRDYAKAFADYTEAIRLDPKLAMAYNNRGNVRRATQDYDRAILDYNEAIRHNPKLASAFNNRGNAWRAKKDYRRAIADYAEAIRLDPTYPWPHYNRAIVYFLNGRDKDKAVADARATILCAGWKDETAIYAALIGEFGARRSHHEGEAKRLLDDAAERCDTGAWPYPVVRFLRGEIDEAALLALGIDDEKRTEVHCFIGIDHALSGRAEKAREHLLWVKEHGTPCDVQYIIGVAELERLDSKSRH